MSDHPADLLERLTPPEIALLLQVQQSSVLHLDRCDPVLKRLLDAGLIDALVDDDDRPGDANFRASCTGQELVKLLNKDGDLFAL